MLAYIICLAASIVWLLLRVLRILRTPMVTLVQTLNIKIPKVPIILVKKITNNSILFIWESDLDKQSGNHYKIYVNGAEIGIADHSQTECELVNLRSESYYQLDVIACTSSNFKSKSSSVFVKTYKNRRAVKNRHVSSNSVFENSSSNNNSSLGAVGANGTDTGLGVGTTSSTVNSIDGGVAGNTGVTMTQNYENNEPSSASSKPNNHENPQNIFAFLHDIARDDTQLGKIKHKNTLSSGSNGLRSRSNTLLMQDEKEALNLKMEEILKLRKIIEIGQEELKNITDQQLKVENDFFEKSSVLIQDRNKLREVKKINDENNHHMKTEIALSEQSIRTLRKELNNLETGVAKFEASMDAKAKEIEDWHSSILKFKKEIKSIETEGPELVESLQKSIDELKQKMEDLQKSNQQLEEQIRKANVARRSRAESKEQVAQKLSELNTILVDGCLKDEQSFDECEILQDLVKLSPDNGNLVKKELELNSELQKAWKDAQQKEVEHCTSVYEKFNDVKQKLEKITGEKIEKTLEIINQTTTNNATTNSTPVYSQPYIHYQTNSSMNSFNLSNSYTNVPSFWDAQNTQSSQLTNNLLMQSQQPSLQLPMPEMSQMSQIAPVKPVLETSSVNSFLPSNLLEKDDSAAVPETPTSPFSPKRLFTFKKNPVDVNYNNSNFENSDISTPTSATVPRKGTSKFFGIGFNKQQQKSHEHQDSSPKMEEPPNFAINLIPDLTASGRTSYDDSLLSAQVPKFRERSGSINSGFSISQSFHSAQLNATTSATANNGTNVWAQSSLSINSIPTGPTSSVTATGGPGISNWPILHIGKPQEVDQVLDDSTGPSTFGSKLQFFKFNNKPGDMGDMGSTGESGFLGMDTELNPIPETPTLPQSKKRKSIFSFSKKTDNNSILSSPTSNFSNSTNAINNGEFTLLSIRSNHQYTDTGSSETVDDVVDSFNSNTKTSKLFPKTMRNLGLSRKASVSNDLNE